MSCPHCGHRIHTNDQREAPNGDSACVHCCPNFEDREQALSDYQERQVDAYRDER